MDKWSIFLIFLVRKRRFSEHKMAGFCLGSASISGCETFADSLPYPMRFIRPKTPLRRGYHWRSNLELPFEKRRQTLEDTHNVFKPDKPFGPSRNTAHTLFDSLLRTSCNVHSPSSPNVVRINTALAWRSERFRLARRFQYAVQEGKLNIKAGSN